MEVRRGVASFFGDDALSEFRAANYRLKDSSEDEVAYEFLSKNKGAYGRPVAEAIVASERYTSEKTIPAKVRELLARIDGAIG